jgi:GT2 family glycosyltransferase
MSGDAPKVSVVIVGCDSLDCLTRCLSSLLKSRYPNFEIIYVDNGSTDASTRYFQAHAGKRGRSIQLDHNYGFTIANNIGAQSAAGEYIVFLNVDTVVDSDWLGPLVSSMERDPSVGAAQSELLQMGSGRIDSLGGFITPYGTVSSRGYGEPAHDLSEVQEVFYSKAAAMITRQSLWKRTGGFDPIFYLYYQETDYCWRLWVMGYRVVCVSDSKVWHAGGVVSGRRPGVLKYYEARERLALLLKNYSVQKLVRYVPVTICFQLANVVRFLLRGNPVSAANIIRGTTSALTHLRAIWKRRRDFSGDKVSEDEILKKLMVVPVIHTIREK